MEVEEVEERGWLNQLARVTQDYLIEVTVEEVEERIIR